MAARLMACISLYHASSIYIGPKIANQDSTATHRFLYHSMNLYVGWAITAAVCLFFTLKGIVQKRSILIFPYLVVLAVELPGLLISIIVIAVVSSLYIEILLALPIVAIILGYEFWCLLSLYKQIKYNENMQLMDTVPMQAV